MQVNFDTRSENQDRSTNRPFVKFFEAMENLKKDIRELNLISDIGSVGSPKSSSQVNRWENIDTLKDLT